MVAPAAIAVKVASGSLPLALLGDSDRARRLVRVKVRGRGEVRLDSEREGGDATRSIARSASPPSPADCSVAAFCPTDVR